MHKMPKRIREINGLSMLPIDVIESLFEDISHHPSIDKCNNLYNALRMEIPSEHARLKEFQRDCYRAKSAYDVPNPPNPSFKLLKDCPENHVCDCGIMHELDPDDPTVIAAQPHAAQLFANCSNLDQCNKLYNVLRKQYPPIDEAQHARLKEFQRHCYSMARYDHMRMTACPENGANPLTPAEQTELWRREHFNPPVSESERNKIIISELFPRCNCGTFHSGLGLRSALLYMDKQRRIKEREQEREQEQNKRNRSMSNGGKRKTMRKNKNNGRRSRRHHNKSTSKIT